MTQATTTCTTHHGHEKKKTSVSILTLGEEDGVLKVLVVKEFADPKEDAAWLK